ncbi:hypothetical protein [Terrabacter sp. 2YAF2]|uniref:hypothetical protein n=1 Tax=Terrabacter sp. 2YAF2 TaxID=3233026 RepID=UPI003F9EB868
MTPDAASAAGAVEATPATPDEEASAREFRRQWAPAPADQDRRSWATFGISGRLSAGWTLTLLVFAVVSLGMIPGSIRAQGDARLLQAQGQSLVSDKVQVHVSHVTSKSGGYYTVDGVRATLPGSSDPELESVFSEPGATQEIYDPMKEGWQPPSARTGYRPPLRVRVRRDANGVVTTAMWQPNYEYLLSADEPLGESILGVFCLVVAGLSMWLNRLRLRHRARRRGTDQPSLGA